MVALVDHGFVRRQSTAPIAPTLASSPGMEVLLSYHIGIDVGGTFTDCVAVADNGRIVQAKSLSTKGDPTVGMVRGIRALADRTGDDLGSLLRKTERLAHGTTIGTNLVVERKGAKVGLICSAGHGDAILMMRGAGGTAGKRNEDIYTPHGTRPPAPIVPRSLILEVVERVERSGQVVVALDEAATRERIAAWLAQEQPDSIAIALLWSIRNDTHERRIEAIIEDLAPGTHISVSSEISPRLGEYERTVATVINAYVGPASSAYITSLSRQLSSAGLREPLLVMQSNGGVVDADVARRVPLALIDSGPTGGLAGAAALARASGHDQVIATDMGGTSFDVGLIIGHQPQIAGERTIGQYTYLLPHLDVRSIACGGGSIATADERTRSIRVGPESAGSEPGPACYGRGGAMPTVTDADVVLGLLRPQAFLDGSMPLDRDASRRVIGGLAEKLGLSLEETAAGIIRINNANAALLIRQRTIEQGYDPREFTIYAFGGAGPVHAFGFAADLGIGNVVIPLGNGASTLSAYGIASADTIRYFEAECQLRTPFDPEQLGQALDAARAAALSALGEGAFVERIESTLLMRYVGQIYQSISVAVPNGPIDENAAAGLLAAFEREYERLFGEGARIVFQAGEAFAIRTKIIGRPGVAPSRLPAPMADSGLVKPVEHQVYWPAQMQWLDTRVIDGTVMSGSDTISGPALVELPHTTVAVAPGQALRLDAFGSMILAISTEAEEIAA